jgi:hypothetical protein
MSAPRPTYARGPLLAASLALALLLPACSEAPAPDAEWPEGALLVAEREALVALAERAELLSGTPLAVAARSLRQALPECALLEAHAPDGNPTALLSSLHCSEPDGALASVDRARGTASMLFAVPVEASGRAIGRATLSGRDVALDLEWAPGDQSGALDLLLPGSAAAGPARLADAERLAHARVRPERGIDLRALIDSESQANQLFALRAALFTSAILDGAWEAAVYLPPPGREMPRMALAFDVHVISAAMAAAEAFIAELASTWEIEAQPFALGDTTRGSCLSELRLMPEFAPCYVTTEQALVVGWNAESLAHALDRAPSHVSEEPGRIELDLALFAEADALLSRHLAPDERPGMLRWPWQRAVARARREEDGLLRVRLELEGALDT